MRYKKIFSKKVMVELIVKGNNLLWTEENRDKKWLSVFVFELTDKLLEDLTGITQ